MLAKGIGIPAFAGVLVIGLLYVRLLHGPVSLDFLVHPIERAIAEEVAGLQVRVEGVVLRLGESNQLEFELKNVRVTDASDVVLALAPSATVSLSRKALLHGRIAPESVDLISPRLSLFYGEDGRLSLKFSTAAVAPEANAPSRRHCVAPPTCRRSPQRRRAERPTACWGASISSRCCRSRPPAHGEASARVPTCAGSGSSRPPLSSTTAAARVCGVCRSSTSISTTNAAAARSPGGPRSTRLPAPWTLNFRTYEHESAKSLQLAVSVQGLVPRGLARTLPQLAGLESFDVPVWGDAKLDLSSTGEILGGTIGIDAAPGQVLLPWLVATPLRIDGGHLALSYNRATRRFEIAPSVIVWGDSRVQFTGSIVHTAQGPEGPGWSFDVNSAGGWIGAEPPLLPRLDLDNWSARGFFSPEHGRVVLSQFQLRAGGAEVSAQGDVADMAGAMQAHLDGKIGPMSVSLFKTLWPAPLAPNARDWIVRRLVRGWVQGGTFRLTSGSGGDRRLGRPHGPRARLADARGSQSRVRRHRQLARARRAPRARAPRRADLRDVGSGRHLRRFPTVASSLSKVPSRST
jgi:hypothetical protein